MKKLLYLSGYLFSVVAIITAKVPITNTISFFIQESQFIDEISVNKFQEVIEKPGKLAYKIANSLIGPKHTGIFATYGGYLTLSNLDGLIAFPRMQQKTDFTIIVTERIQPIFMLGNTIHHWELLRIPTAIYSISRKQDPETNLYYWDTQRAQRPKKNIIPLSGIVIFAKPRSIIVPIGISLTNNNNQLVLPTLYATKNINRLSPSLELLKIRQFFGPLLGTSKKASDVYYSKQIMPSQ